LDGGSGITYEKAFEERLIPGRTAPNRLRANVAITGHDDPGDSLDRMAAASPFSLGSARTCEEQQWSLSRSEFFHSIHLHGYSNEDTNRRY